MTMLWTKENQIKFDRGHKAISGQDRVTIASERDVRTLKRAPRTGADGTIEGPVSLRQQDIFLARIAGFYSHSIAV